MLFLLIQFIGVILVLPLSVTAASLNTVEMLIKNQLALQIKHSIMIAQFDGFEINPIQGTDALENL